MPDAPNWLIIMLASGILGYQLTRSTLYTALCLISGPAGVILIILVQLWIEANERWDSEEE
jgi:hypothetical protein